MKLTNPARLLWPEEGITKQGLADFYTEIADWILPHIRGVRSAWFVVPAACTSSASSKSTPGPGWGKRFGRFPIPGDDEPMLAIDDLAGLLELVQAGVLEIHPWGSTVGPARSGRTG